MTTDALCTLLLTEPSPFIEARRLLGRQGQDAYWVTHWLYLDKRCCIVDEDYTGTRCRHSLADFYDRYAAYCWRVDCKM